MSILMFFQALRLSNSARPQQHGGRDSQPHVGGQPATDGPGHVLPHDMVRPSPDNTVSRVPLSNHGASIFAGFGVMLLLIPVNAVIAYFSRKFQVSCCTCAQLCIFFL